MKEKLLNLLTSVFILTFSLTTFEVAVSKPANSQGAALHVKSHPQFNKNFSGNTFVLDGDSLRVGGKEVRLYGIDAPEYNQTCFDAKKKEYPCGQKSREFLINLAGGKQVECAYFDMDKYDRYLSKCSVGKASINEELIKSGMAVIYSFTEADEKMEKLEAEAKKNKLGVWQGAFQLPKDYRKAHPRK